MDTVIVFTGKDLNAMRKDGGSGHWKAKSDRINEATYLVAVRNIREQWASKDVQHGTAFLVGKITATVESERDDRVVIGLSEYATIHVENAWQKLTNGQRYPVTYMESGDVQELLGVNFGDLDWQPFEESNMPGKTSAPSSPIAAAKATLAAQLGIPVESIEIIIRA